jgi:GLPGLI family protein
MKRFYCRYVLLIGMVFLALPMCVKAQKDVDSVKLRIYYNHSHIRDLQSAQKVHTDQLVLLLGENSSLFVSFEKISLRKDRKQYVKKMIDANQVPTVQMTGKQHAMEEILRPFGMQRIEVQDYLGRFFIYNEELPSIEWSLDPATKDILGYPCQKATAFFLGRDWEVWFTSEIPLPVGPWKLGGLPGAILAAEDKEGHVKYEAISIQSASVIDSVLAFEGKYLQLELERNRSRVITKAEFEKLKAQALKNPVAFEKMQFQTSRPMETTDFGVDGTISWAYRIPNPIARIKP